MAPSHYFDTLVCAADCSPIRCKRHPKKRSEPHLNSQLCVSRSHLTKARLREEDHTAVLKREEGGGRGEGKTLELFFLSHCWEKIKTKNKRALDLHRAGMGWGRDYSVLLLCFFCVLFFRTGF